MVSNDRSLLFVIFRKYGKCCLAFNILLGLSLGIYTAGISSYPFSSLMRGTGICAVSIVRMLCAMLLPLLFAALAVVLSKPNILHLLMFLRAFMHGFCLCGLFAMCGQAGWLAAMLCLFTPSAVNFALCWFCIRYFKGFTHRSLSVVILLASACTVVCLVDALVILPFLTILSF